MDEHRRTDTLRFVRLNSGPSLAWHGRMAVKSAKTAKKQFHSQTPNGGWRSGNARYTHRISERIGWRAAARQLASRLPKAAAPRAERNGLSHNYASIGGSAVMNACPMIGCNHKVRLFEPRTTSASSSTPHFQRQPNTIPPLPFLECLLVNEQFAL
jgi:hypothetical protein